MTHPDRGSPQGGVVSPLLSNIMLHEVDRQWCRGDGTMSNSVVLVRYADDMVLLARTESEAKQAWEHLQSQFAALRLVVNQEKSRLTTVEEGFAFLGFEFRKPPRRLLYMWPRKKACQYIRDRRSARKRWNYQFLYKRCRLYQMVGRVSHLPGLRRTPPEEDGRRAGCGKTARPVR